MSSVLIVSILPMLTSNDVSTISFNITLIKQKTFIMEVLHEINYHYISSDDDHTNYISIRLCAGL